MIKELREFEVVLDQPDGVCHAGEKVSGTVILDLTEPMELTKLYLWFSGKGRVHYMLQKWSRNVGSYTNDYKTDETYFDSQTIILYGSPGNVLQPGRMAYPFEFDLAGSLPSSYEGKHGHVRYFCKAVFEKPEGGYELKQPFTVLRALDLNAESGNLMMPLTASNQTEITSCFGSGSVTASLQVDRGGYVPGENVYVTAEVVNKSGSAVSNVRVALKQNIHFFGVSDSVFSDKRLKAEYESVIIAHFKAQGKIAKRSSGKWNNVALNIPSIPPSRLDGCDIIRIAYVIEFQADVKHGKDISLPLKLLIGTVPIRSGGLPGVTGSGLHVAHPGYKEETLHQAPPSYEVSMMGRQDISEDHDSQNTRGPLEWAPRYPIYTPGGRGGAGSNHQAQVDNHQAPGVPEENHNSVEGADEKRQLADDTLKNRESQSSHGNDGESNIAPEKNAAPQGVSGNHVNGDNQDNHIEVTTRI